MGVGDEEAVDEVRLLHRGGGLALPSPLLRRVGVDRLPLDVAPVREGYDRLPRTHEIRRIELHFVADDLGAARVGILFPDLDELVANHRLHAFGILEDLEEIRGCGASISSYSWRILVLLEAREAVQAEIQDSLRLPLGESVARFGEAGIRRPDLFDRNERPRALEHAPPPRPVARPRAEAPSWPPQGSARPESAL